jgi:hypothetical protein
LGQKGNEMTLQPHQQRVIAERGELAERLDKLNAFIGGELWLKLPEDERDLLVEQRGYMTAYLGVLQRRSARFLSL